MYDATLYYNTTAYSAEQINSLSSLVSDYAWAFAMLLTTPLVVTVGISLSIPLSLIGQMIISNQYSSAMYWVGALIVFGSFVFINHESKDTGEEETVRRTNIEPVRPVITSP